VPLWPFTSASPKISKQQGHITANYVSPVGSGGQKMSDRVALRPTADAQVGRGSRVLDTLPAAPEEWEKRREACSARWTSESLRLARCRNVRQFSSVCQWSAVTWPCTVQGTPWDRSFHNFLQLLGKRQGTFRRWDMAGNSPALTEAIKWPLHTKSQRPSTYATDPLRVQNPDIHQARVIPKRT